MRRRRDSTDAVNTSQNRVQSRQPSLRQLGFALHPQREETQLHGYVNRLSRYDELPRRADPDASAATVSKEQQCSIAYKLTGGVCEVARHPLRRESVEEVCGKNTPS